MKKAKAPTTMPTPKVANEAPANRADCAVEEGTVTGDVEEDAGAEVETIAAQTSDGRGILT